MSKIEIESGRSSSATHRLTQASTTLNRRYVKRPANFAVEEAARAAEQRAISATSMPAAPSRLVNRNVSSAALEAARLEEERKAEEAARAAAEYAEYERMQQYQYATMIPNVVEFGQLSPDMNSTYEASIAGEPVTVVNSNPENTYNPSEQMIYPNYNPDPNAIQPMPESYATDQSQAYNNTAYNNYSNDYNSNYTAPDTTNYNAYNSPAQTSSTPEIDTEALTMSIAADYAAASFGVSMGNNEAENSTSTQTGDSSVDAIARAASEAIASIRVATDPSEVSEQVNSLKAFAENIKANHNTPEMKELGDTIDKFVSIAMKSTKVQEAVKNNKDSSKPSVKVSLSSKANRAATKVTKSSAKVMAASRKANTKPLSRTNTRNLSQANLKNAGAKRLSSGMTRNRAIEDAIHNVATMESRNSKNQPKPLMRRKSSVKRFIVAFACATACVIGVLAYVSTNIPDVSVKVAAMQTGIQAKYPSYIPRDYNLSDVLSEEGKITMIFSGPDKSSFSLIEEKSSWDSSALLRNYVEPTWNDNYATTHEQGITIYISNVNADAAWVNGGILYKITSEGTALTKKQVRSIVVSL